VAVTMRRPGNFMTSVKKVSNGFAWKAEAVKISKEN
jgi:hypothetical protein